MDIHSKETKHTSHEKAARTSHEETAYLTKKQHISQNQYNNEATDWTLDSRQGKEMFSS
jgi:hypothetical protein